MTSVRSFNKDGVSVKIENDTFHFFQLQAGNAEVSINEILRSYMNNVVPKSYHPAYGYSADKERDCLVADAFKKHKDGDSLFYEAGYKYFDKYIKIGLEPFIRSAPNVDISKELHIIIDMLSKDLEFDCLNNLPMLREMVEIWEKEDLI